MTPKLEFCLLGPVAVRRDGVSVPVPRGRQRAVLAVLLLNAGRVVSVGEITETLWGHAPLPSAPATVRNYVKRLRHVLGDADQGRIVTRSPGYMIRVDPGELDVTRFELLLEGARDAARAGSWEAAADQARAALGLWRGEPLADVESDALAVREIPRLAELRLQAAELRIDAELRLGRHGVVIAELERLAAAHPLREHLHALLMLALYRDGRQAEALAAYRHARRVLVDELGAEPGAELHELHRQILTTGRQILTAGRPAGARPGPIVPRELFVPRQLFVPRELPGPVRQFAGRAAELADLTGMLEQVSEQTLVVPVISGMGGVGKTALALQWAHQVADRFPDGQLHVNLRGYDPGQPVSAAAALAGFLRSLGVAEQDIPAEASQRAARYRSLLAGRRMLIMIDNAADAEQVRPLLPASPSCAAVVTSRDALAGLVARDGARRLDLDPLPPAEARGLLRALIGEKVDAEPEATETLAGYCARLPLALRVAAERAAASPGISLAEVASDLADQRERLDRLDAAGDGLTAVRAVFSWSIRHLDDETARAFRLLGLHPGAEFDAYAAAALADITLRQARRLLDRLARAHLVQPAGTGRYDMHDLLRAYAADQAAEQDSEQERGAALSRLFDHYLATATAVAGTLFGADPDLPAPPSRVGPVPPVPSPAAALAWLDAWRSTLVAIAAYAADHGWPGHAIGLAATVFRYLDAGHFTEAAAMHRHARRAAALSGDRAAEAAALTMLGAAEIAQGRLRQATGHLEQALALCRADGDRIGEARALGHLGLADYCRSRYARSARCHRLALAIYLELGDHIGEAREFHALGVLDLRQGRYEEATGHVRRSLALFRDAGCRPGEAFVLGYLGELELRQGRYGQAAVHLRRSLGLGREIGSRLCQARALAGLGVCELRQGRHVQAAGLFRQSLGLHREAGNCSGQAEALNGLGEAFLAASQAGQASARHAAALALALQVGDKHEEARARGGLASAGPDDRPTMPVEFSVAAYRLGHSMVRDVYNWNAAFNTKKIPASLLLLFAFSGTSGILAPPTSPDQLNDPTAGAVRLPSNWVADFRRLYDFTEAGRDDLAVPHDDFNTAKRIDTLLVNPLQQLPLGAFGGRDAAVRARGRELNLAFRNLTRAGMVRLCSGQQLAEQFGMPPLDPGQILAGDGGASLDGLADDQKKSFTQNTPLWFYILREAELNGGRLTGVGGRIVAEVFHRAMEGSRASIVKDPGWRPTLSPGSSIFRMTDLLLFAFENNKELLAPLG